MMNSPCAMLMTPIWPNVSARPSAASRRIDPTLSPLNTWVTRTPMRDLSVTDPAPARLPHAGSDGNRARPVTARPGAFGRLAAEAAGPGVRLEVRVGLDRLAGRPVGVDQAVLRDLADERGLGDVVVVAVHRHRALRGGE